MREIEKRNRKPSLLVIMDRNSPFLIMVSNIDGIYA
jgi:hypothetical protein